MRLVRFVTISGDEIAINPEFVSAVTPTNDKQGVRVIGTQVVHTNAGLAFAVRAPLGEICQALEGMHKVAL